MLKIINLQPKNVEIFHFTYYNSFFLQQIRRKITYNYGSHVYVVFTYSASAIYSLKSLKGNFNDLLYLITFEFPNYYACNWFNQKVLPPLMKAITWCCILGSYKIVALQECITSSFFQFRWLQFCQKELDELRLLSEFLFYYRIIFSRLHLLGLLKQFPHTVWFLSMMKRIYFFHTATFQMADSPNLSVPFCIKREDTLSVKITANILQSLIGIL